MARVRALWDGNRAFCNCNVTPVGRLHHKLVDIYRFAIENLVGQLESLAGYCSGGLATPVNHGAPIRVRGAWPGGRQSGGRTIVARLDANDARGRRA
jgi:hypothetical protein